MHVDHVRFADKVNSDDGHNETVVVTIETQPRSMNAIVSKSSNDNKHLEQEDNKENDDRHSVGFNNGGNNLTMSVEELNLLDLFDYDFLPPPRPISPFDSENGEENTASSLTNSDDNSNDKSDSVSNTDSMSDTEKSEFESFMKEIMEFNWETKVPSGPQMVSFDSIENLPKIQSQESKTKDKNVKAKQGDGRSDKVKSVHFSEIKETDMDYDRTVDVKETIENPEKTSIETKIADNKVRLVLNDNKRNSQVKRKGFVCDEERELEYLMNSMRHYGQKWAKMENVEETLKKKEEMEKGYEYEVENQNQSNKSFDEMVNKDSVCLNQAVSLRKSPVAGIDNPSFMFSSEENLHKDSSHDNCTASESKVIKPSNESNVLMVSNVMFENGDEDFHMDNSFDEVELMEEETETGSQGFVNDGYLYDEVPSTESTASDDEEFSDVEERHISFASLEIGGSKNTETDLEPDNECEDLSVEREKCEKDPLQNALDSLHFVPDEDNVLTRTNKNNPMNTESYFEKESGNENGDQEWLRFGLSQQHGYYGNPEAHFIPIKKDETDNRGLPYLRADQEKELEQLQKQHSVSLRIGKQLQSKPYYENSKQELVEELKVVLANLNTPGSRLGQTNGFGSENNLNTGQKPRLGHSYSFSVHKQPKETIHWPPEPPRKPARSYSMMVRRTGGYKPEEIFDWFQQKHRELCDDRNKENVTLTEPLHTRCYSADDILDATNFNSYQPYGHKIQEQSNQQHPRSQFKVKDMQAQYGDGYDDYDFADGCSCADLVILSHID